MASASHSRIFLRALGKLFPYNMAKTVASATSLCNSLSNIVIAPKVRPHYDVGFIVVYEVFYIWHSLFREATGVAFVETLA